MHTPMVLNHAVLRALKARVPVTVLVVAAAVAVPVSAGAQDTDPVGPVVELHDGALVVGGRAVRPTTPLPAGLPRARTFAAEGGDGVHAWWPARGLPDDPDTHVLALPREDETLEVVGTWLSSQPERVVGTDLDGNGKLEIVRDRDEPFPCGLRGWWEPAVWSEADATFVPVSIRPARDEIAVTVSAVAVAPDVQPLVEPFVWSSGEQDARSALVDGDPGTGWTEGAPGAGVGQWVALQSPDTFAVRGLRLAAATEEGPVRVSVAFDDGTTVLVAADGTIREAIFDTAGTCAVVTVLDAGDGDTTRFTELSLVVDADRADAATRAREAWPTVVASACAAGDPGRASNAARRAVTEAGVDAMYRLAESEERCMARSAAGAVDLLEANAVVPVARAAETSEVARSALLGAVRGTDALVAVTDVLGAGEHGADWQAAALRLALAEPDTSQSGRLLDLAVADPALETLAVQVAAAWTHAPWPPATGIPEDDEAALRTLRIANTLPAGTFAPTDAAITAALDRDNGSVARLALLAIGRHGLTASTDSVADLLAHDPSPHLRAAAVVAADGLGTLDARADRAADDPHPTVRLAVAATDWGRAFAGSQPGDAAVRVAEEPWPDVRRAWIAALIDADDAAADGTLARAVETHPDDVPYALRRWSARATAVPPEVFAVARRAGADPAALPWTLLLLPLADGACDDLEWLGAIRDRADVPDDVRAAIDEAVGACTD